MEDNKRELPQNVKNADNKQVVNDLDLEPQSPPFSASTGKGLSPQEKQEDNLTIGPQTTNSIIYNKGEENL